MENPFKPGDIVFHKANNLRMVVLATFESSCSCRYVSAAGQFTKMEFSIQEISATKFDDTLIIYQLESKAVNITA